jgi:hypothetical protein
VQNTPKFMPCEPSFLQIEVIANDADGTFQTNLHCSVNDCRRIVVIESDGPKADQNISCPKHGFLTLFPHLNALREFVRFLANKILAANGHGLIETEALSIFGDVQSPAGSLN